MVPREKKIGPLLGPSGGQICHMPIFFTKKIFFRPALFLSRLEQPKRPPNAPGLVSVAAAVLWQHYFHRRPPTAPPARRSREALVDRLLKFKLLGGSGAFSIMQIRLKQPSSLHRPLVQLCIWGHARTRGGLAHRRSGDRAQGVPVYG